jgi:Ca2+-binding RTX toxin-like protein
MATYKLTTGYDTITGTGDADTFDGKVEGKSGGTDTLNGAGGNDTFLLEKAAGTVNGGEGIDTLFTSDLGTAAYVSVEILDAEGDFIRASLAKLDSFSLFTRSAAPEDNIVFEVIGEGGIFDFTGRTLDGHGVTIHDYGVSDGYNITGTQFDDILVGSSYSDVLIGGDGNDMLFAQFFNWYGPDVLDGGNGNDRLEIDDAEGDFLGGNGNDLFIVSDCSGTVVGGAGVDTVSFGMTPRFGSVVFKSVEILDLTGLEYGFYISISQLGAFSTVKSAEGERPAINLWKEGGSINFATRLSGSSVFVDAQDTESSVDIVGTALADTIYGSSYDDTLDGHRGADTVDGGNGNDTYFVDIEADIVNEAAGRGTADRVAARVSYALVADAEIEHLTTTSTAGTAAINLTGNALKQTITGNAGANVLHDGGAGVADVMKGLGGNDTYRVYNSGDVIVETASQGVADRVIAAVDYKLVAGVHIEIMATDDVTGTSGIDLTGNSLKQDITGNAGNNTLSSGAAGAADTMRGLEGNDTYLIYNSGDIIVETATQGKADKVAAAADYTLGAGVHVEIMTTTSAAGTSAINLTGNALAQDITGNAGNNILSSGAAGSADTLRGLGGDDIYRVYNSGDIIVETASQGAADRVMAAVDYKLGAGVHVEIMTTNGTTGTSGIDLTGNEIAQSITGNAGANVLDGKGGNDVLNGLGGKDTLRGGTGSDIFVFDTALGAANVDTIADFSVVDDTIRLENAIFAALTTTGTLSLANFRANTTGEAQDSNDRIIYETDTGRLYYDADANGAGARIHFATLTGLPTLTNADFAVV